MERDEILELVKRIILVRLIDVEEEDITEDASFVDDLGADETDIVEIEMALEEEFGIDMLDDAVLKFETVGDAVDYIHESL